MSSKNGVLERSMRNLCCYGLESITKLEKRGYVSAKVMQAFLQVSPHGIRGDIPKHNQPKKTANQETLSDLEEFDMFFIDYDKEQISLALEPLKNKKKSKLAKVINYKKVGRWF